MVDRVLTREQFYAQYPNFASMAWGSPERDKWLANHPGAAAQWTAVRDVEQKMTQTYGQDWRTTAGEQWSRVTADYLDGGFGDKATAPAPAAPGATPAPAPAAGSPAATPSAPTPGGTADQSAKAVLTQTLAGFGLESLGEWAWGQYLNGVPAEQIMLDIRKRPEYAARFPAMAELSKQGRAISEQQYIDAERNYQAQMRAYGLPEGFYDDPTDFSKLISNNVSGTEFGERLALAQQASLQSPQGQQLRDQLSRIYGISGSIGQITAYFIDPDRASTLIKQQVAAGQVAAEASSTGFGSLTKDQAERVAGWVDAEAARAGFSQLATMDELKVAGLGDAGDQGVSDDTMLDAAFGGDAGDKRTLERSAKRRVAAFDGGGGYAAGQGGVSGLGTA